MKKRKITTALIEKFLDYLQESEKSINTIQKYLHDVRVFARFNHGRAISKSTALEYKAFLEVNYNVTSANSMIAALNSFFKYAGWNDCTVKQFKTQKKIYCSEKSELSKSEYDCLVKTAERKNNIRLSLIIQTICGTGIRVSELGYITVEAVKSGEAIVSCKGKTRTVFVVSALQKKLLNYAQKHNIKSGAIFVTKGGKVINRSNIWREMKLLCKTAGISADKVFPHNLRHLFARTFYSIEKDIAKLADILGHASINTTRIYMISTGAEHRRKLERMRLII